VTACATRQQAPVRYEVPKEVAAEAIANAVAHRDYTGQRPGDALCRPPGDLEPGQAPAVPLEKLRQAHGSVPANPLPAEPMMAREAIELYIEGMLARGKEIPTEEGLLEYTLTVEAHA
jgi:hypothetical protein